MLDAGDDRYEHEIANGRLVLRGTDAIAVAVAARDAAAELGADATWDSRRWLALPDALEDRPLVARATSLAHRYYLNFVTFGYTTAFWGWERWEREVDWMALHGITTPLMTLAHEAVLTETYRELGLSDERIAEWIGGASHFPWTWMGGTNEWGGPLPLEWNERHLDLARRVLERQRAFGMTPVLPGFMGHVPPELAGDGSGTIEWQGWTTPVLSPRDPAFARIAEVFYRHQRDLLGTDHLYAADPFIESVPPSGDPEDLGAMSAGIFEAMRQSDPDAVWVLQGWPFHYQAEFWTDERIGAFFAPVPRSAVLVLDLWAEHAPMWRRTDGMWGRPWVWCAVHNFGSRPALFGDLTGLRRDLTVVQDDADRGDLAGFGITTEAIENNAVFYELACDLVWRPAPDEERWLDRFAGARYGVDAPEARHAWRILARTLYGPGRTRSTPSPVIARPWSDTTPFATQRLAGEFVDTSDVPRESANIDAENDPAVLGDLAAVADAIDALVALAGREGVDRDTLDRDLVDLAGHVIAQHSRLAIRGVLAGYAAGDPAAIGREAARFAAALDELDRLAGTVPGTRVAAWLDRARSWSDDAGEQAILERDARRLVSVWGEQSSGLHDYSGRHWEGLVRDLYRPRWLAWTGWLEETARAGGAADEGVLRRRIVRIEEDWVRSHHRYSAVPEGAAVDAAATAVASRRAELDALRESA